MITGDLIFFILLTIYLCIFWLLLLQQTYYLYNPQSQREPQRCMSLNPGFFDEN